MHFLIFPTQSSLVVVLSIKRIVFKVSVKIIWPLGGVTIFSATCKQTLNQSKNPRDLKLTSGTLLQVTNCQFGKKLPETIFPWLFKQYFFLILPENWVWNWLKIVMDQVKVNPTECRRENFSDHIQTKFWSQLFLKVLVLSGHVKLQFMRTKIRKQCNFWIYD